MDGQKQDLRCKICNSKHEGIFRISIFHQLKTAKFASGAPPTMDRRKELHIPEVGKVYHVKLNGPLKEEGQILGNRARLCSSNIKIRQLLDDESQLKPMEDSMIIIGKMIPWNQLVQTDNGTSICSRAAEGRTIHRDDREADRDMFILHRLSALAVLHRKKFKKIPLIVESFVVKPKTMVLYYAYYFTSQAMSPIIRVKGMVKELGCV